MKTIHALSIALLLGTAATLGGFAATRTVTGSQAHAAGAPPAATLVASRTARLDRWQQQLQRALHHRVPKLPPLAHFRKPVPAPAAAPAPAFVAQTSRAAPRTIYVHAKAPPAAPRHEHDDEHEDGQSRGGSHDD